MDAYPDLPAVRLIHDAEAIKMLFDPMRLRIVSVLAAPCTVQRLAEHLAVPFTRLYYHLNLLEKHGIIEVVATREGPGAIEEKVYRVTAREFLIDRALLTFGATGRAVVSEVIVTQLAEASAELQRSLSDGAINLTSTPPTPDALLIRRSYMRLTEAQVAELYTRLLELLTWVAAQTPADGEPTGDYTLLALLHPTHYLRTPAADAPLEADERPLRERDTPADLPLADADA